jgi:nucleotide-binding universal stress UspA family protein
MLAHRPTMEKAEPIRAGGNTSAEKTPPMNRLPRAKGRNIMTTAPTRPITVGADGSPQSLRAVAWAAREAAARRCPLQITHAFLWPLYPVPLGPPPVGPPDAGLRNAAERILRDAAEQARHAAPGVQVTTDLPVCGPGAALIQASGTSNLIVVGRRGLGAITGLIAGSVGVQTVAHAACPVVIVPDGPPLEPYPAGNRVVVGVDTSQSAEAALDFAFDYAARHHLKVLAIHADTESVGSVPHDPRLIAYAADIRDDHDRQLVEVLARCNDRYPGVPVRLQIIPGRPTDLLVSAGRHAALTVVGSRGRGGLTGLLFGSTSQDVLHHIEGPVAVVRNTPTRTSVDAPSRDPGSMCTPD